MLLKQIGLLRCFLCIQRFQNVHVRRFVRNVYVYIFLFYLSLNIKVENVHLQNITFIFQYHICFTQKWLPLIGICTMKLGNVFSVSTIQVSLYALRVPQSCGWHVTQCLRKSWCVVWQRPGWAGQVPRCTAHPTPAHVRRQAAHCQGGQYTTRKGVMVREVRTQHTKA